MDETSQSIPISDKENSKAFDSLNFFIDDWNLTATEKTVGPIPDNEQDESLADYSIDKASFYKKKESIFQKYYNVKLFKFALKTSLMLTISETDSFSYSKQRASGLGYKTYAGKSGKLRVVNDND